MSISGNLTVLLKPEYIAQGYTLSEDEDFLYQHRDGKTVATFSSHGASIEGVQEFIESQVLLESVGL